MGNNETVDQKDLIVSESTFIPTVIYLNADSNKELILKENKNKSGAYRWTNLISGKTYIPGE